jgi:hypothetical protein
MGQERIEGAKLADMGKWSRAGGGGHLENLLGRRVKKIRVCVDEAADQPRTGDAVDLRTLSTNFMTVLFLVCRDTMNLSGFRYKCFLARIL